MKLVFKFNFHRKGDSYQRNLVPHLRFTFFRTWNRSIPICISDSSTFCINLNFNYESMLVQTVHAPRSWRNIHGIRINRWMIHVECIRRLLPTLCITAEPCRYLPVWPKYVIIFSRGTTLNGPSPNWAMSLSTSFTSFVAGYLPGFKNLSFPLSLYPSAPLERIS